jgi:selenocysteine-specific elongation factor
LIGVSEAVLRAASEYHGRHPLEDGIPREELRERLFATAPLVVFEHVLTALQQRGTIVARDRVALASHHLQLSDEDARARDAIVRAIRDAGLMPPDQLSLAARIAAPAAVVERMTALLVRQKVLIRLGDLLFHEAALNGLKAEIQGLKRAGTAASIDVPAFKERYGLSRKFAIPLLEFLDRERVTRRVGDTRQIV